MQRFMFGTVVVSGVAEEAEARPAIERALAEVFPNVPEILALIPGAIVFQAEAEDDAQLSSRPVAGGAT